MSINLEVQNVTCLQIEEPSVSDRLFNGKRNYWRNMIVTTADGKKITLCFFGCRENDYVFPLVIGGENE